MDELLSQQVVENTTVTASSAPVGEEWTAEELDLAYYRALQAIEGVETQVSSLLPDEPQPSAVPPAREGMRFDASHAREIREPHAIFSPEGAPVAGVAPHRSAPQPKTETPAPLQPQQVIEAILFVGGPGLTAARLASMLRGDYSAQDVENFIDQLNVQYRRELRPYEIRLREGGYYLTLTEPYERLMLKVYGLGPREVRLSQEALEVLALIAWHQPITEQQLAEYGRSSCGAILRQLLRRDLIALLRDPEQPKQPRYITTPRFLSVFGLKALSDLPHPDQLLLK
ncbi:MAG: hypothetical protein KatS3mg113_0467 [Planctomycetaceae bacterium]|nr:MAG: hypothetical protein KatS3mg113_0467 [Planctomycetaceae bacterium]